MYIFKKLINESFFNIEQDIIYGFQIIRNSLILSYFLFFLVYIYVLILKYCDNLMYKISFDYREFDNSNYMFTRIF